MKTARTYTHENESYWDKNNFLVQVLKAVGRAAESRWPSVTLWERDRAGYETRTRKGYQGGREIEGKLDEEREGERACWMPEVLRFHPQQSKPQALEFSSPTRHCLPASTKLSHIPHQPAQCPSRPHHCTHGFRRGCWSVVSRKFCGLLWKSSVGRGTLPVHRGYVRVQVKRIKPQVGWTALAAGKLFVTINLVPVFGEERENKEWCMCVCLKAIFTQKLYNLLLLNGFYETQFFLLYKKIYI